MNIIKRIWKETWDTIVALGVALSIYISLGYALNTTMPLTAVVSHSMEPTYSKGDMLVVYGVDNLEIGDVIVYKNPTTHLPIVHRIINTTKDGFITKGDANPVDDVTGKITPRPIQQKDIYGKVVLRFPLLGWVKILAMKLLGQKV
jgi:signal peptidase